MWVRRATSGRGVRQESGAEVGLDGRPATPCRRCFRGRERVRGWVPRPGGAFLMPPLWSHGPRLLAGSVTTTELSTP